MRAGPKGPEAFCICAPFIRRSPGKHGGLVPGGRQRRCARLPGRRRGRVPGAPIRHRICEGRMFGRWKGRGGEPQPAQPPEGAYVAAGFPRGLPDGDLRKPLATARWPSDAQAFELLGEWEAGPVPDRAGQRRALCRPRRRPAHPDRGRLEGRQGREPDRAGAPHLAAQLHRHRPEGELATITASRRGHGSQWALAIEGEGEVYVLDPFRRVTGPAETYRAAFNPLRDARPGHG